MYTTKHKQTVITKLTHIAFTYQDVFDENDYNDRDQNQWVNRQEQDRPNNCRHSDIVSAFIVLH